MSDFHEVTLQSFTAWMIPSHSDTQIEQEIFWENRQTSELVWFPSIIGTEEKKHPQMLRDIRCISYSWRGEIYENNNKKLNINFAEEANRWQAISQ